MAPASTGNDHETEKDCDCVALQARIRELEAQVAAQSQQLESHGETERDLQAVNHILQHQSKTMLQHFACMSHEIR